MKKMLALAVACALLAGCYSSNDARKALQAEGFTDIQITGHAWFACSEDDFYNKPRFGFGGKFFFYCDDYKDYDAYLIRYKKRYVFK